MGDTRSRKGLRGCRVISARRSDSNPRRSVLVLARLGVDPRGWPGYLHRKGWIAFNILAAAYAAVFLLAVVALPGAPEHRASGYFFDDHGFLIRASADAYHDGVALEVRMLAGIGLVFYAFGLLVNFSVLNKYPRPKPGMP